MKRLSVKPINKDIIGKFRKQIKDTLTDSDTRNRFIFKLKKSRTQTCSSQSKSRKKEYRRQFKSKHFSLTYSAISVKLIT